MTEKGKYETLLIWLAFDDAAHAENCTDAYIDQQLKNIHPELRTPSGDWGLQTQIDRLFTHSFISYSECDSKFRDGKVKCYAATDRGILYAHELVARDRLIKGIMYEGSDISPYGLLDAVLHWFAMKPDDWQGGVITPRINMTANIIAENVIGHYAKELNSADFIINVDLILDQLHIDGYLFKNDEEKWRPKYSLTLKGKIFSEEGGYKGANKKRFAENLRLENIEQAQRAYERQMTYLTVILAISGCVAAVYYLAEMKHDNKMMQGIDVEIFLLVFLMIVIFIFIIKELILKPKKNAA